MAYNYYSIGPNLENVQQSVENDTNIPIGTDDIHSIPMQRMRSSLFGSNKVRPDDMQTEADLKAIPL